LNNTTKDKICDTAIRLFNEKGYENVSLREIAEAAGTTIGNLTYHFAQKELLLENIAQRFKKEFFPQLMPSISDKDRLEYVVMTFFRFQSYEEQAPVYYKNIFEFSKNSPPLAQQNKVFRKSLYDYYFFSFSSFRENGIFRDEITEEQISVLAYTIVFFSMLWIQNTTPYYDEQLPTIPLADALCSLLQPCLTKEYVKEYQDIYTRQRTKEVKL